MIRTQDGYFAGRVVYPTERSWVEAQLRELRPAVLDARHDFVAYLIVSVLLTVACVLVVLFPIHLFLAMAPAVSLVFFAAKAGITFESYRDAREAFSHLCSRRLVLVMDEANDAETEAWMRRSKEKARSAR